MEQIPLSKVDQSNSFFRDSLSSVMHEDYLKPTAMCDSDGHEIKRAALNIVRNSRLTHLEIAQRFFYWVRDNIKYELGLYSEPASVTLKKAAGSCSNKANLYAALLRSLGIPAGFHFLEVQTKNYFGTLCLKRFGQFMSEKSLHVFGCAAIDGDWLEVDPTDDIRLSQSTQHLTEQASIVEFKDKTHAMLKIDPSHIISRTKIPLANIDHILTKKSRIHPEVISFMNLYMDYLRTYSILFNSEEELEQAFFDWFQKEKPVQYERFVAYETFLKEKKVLADERKVFS